MSSLENNVLEEAESKHYVFQQECYSGGSKKLQNMLLLYHNRIKDYYWNYATKLNIDEKSLRKIIGEIIDFYTDLNRQPTIYLTPFSRPKNLPELIKTFGFQSKYRDAWMFYDNSTPRIELPEGFTIRRVESKDEMKVFVEIFNQSYSGATPEEPWGALPKEYGECLFDSFKNSGKDKTVVNFLGFFKGNPVGIATLIYSGKFGVIYNVGTIPQLRKKGIGAALTLNAVSDSIKNNARIIFLQTEDGSYNEAYYKKFVGEGFCRD